VFKRFQSEVLVDNAFRLHDYVILGFRRGVGEIIAVLALHAAQNGRFGLFYTAQNPKTARSYIVTSLKTSDFSVTKSGQLILFKEKMAGFP
jgi:hypothetical protein